MCRPDLIEYNKLTKAAPLQNLNNAFNVADQKLGLTPLLDAEGEMHCAICNCKFCVTFVYCTSITKGSSLNHHTEAIKLLLVSTSSKQVDITETC